MIKICLSNVNLLGRTDAFKILNDLSDSRQDKIVKFLQDFTVTYERDHGNFVLQCIKLLRDNELMLQRLQMLD